MTCIQINRLIVLIVALLSLALVSACGGTPAGGGSSATVSDSTVYFGGTNAKLYALDANTGALKWTYAGESNKPLGGIYSQPAVDNGIIYFGALNGMLYALKASDHTLKWQLDLTADAADMKGVIASPTLADGMLFIGANDHKFFALDAATGQVRWKFTANERIWGAATVADRLIYFGSLDHHLYALNLDGTKKWDFDAGGMIVSKPLVANGLVYFGALEKLFALDAATGTVKWQASRGPNHWIWSSPTLHDNLIYVGDLGGEVLAFDAQAGNLKWTFTVPASDTSRAVSSSVVVNSSLAYAGTSNNENVNAPTGTVYALDLGSGQQKWAFLTQGSVFASPTVADDTLYVNTHLHTFYALGATDGKLKWAFDESKDAPAAPPQ